MITLRTDIRLQGITGAQITEFLLNCTDEEYQRWWPGTHLEFHALRRYPGDVGNVMWMDEYIGPRRVKAKAVVREVVPGERVVWQISKWIRLPIWFTLELADAGDELRLTHLVEAGHGGLGKLLDPLWRLYFSRRFADAMDEHVRTEFPKLRDMLRG